MSRFIRTIQLFEHPPFTGKMTNIIVFQAFEHSCLKLLFQYLNTYTLRSSNGGRWRSTSLWQSLRSYRRVTERLLAYYKCFQTSTIDYCSHFWISTRILLSLRSLNWGCQRCANPSTVSAEGVREWLQNLWQYLWSSYRSCLTSPSLRRSMD